MSNATASSPTEVGRRTHRGWLTPGAVLVGAIGTVGVALGYSGYRELHRTASVWDALYSALQLLTLNADATPDGVSTPVALNIGRFLCALASASTLGLILVRLVLGADRLRLWISRDYVLVFGSTVAARKLAEAAAVKSRRARPWSCRAVLVGRSHATTATDRWRTGLVVVDPQQPDAVARLVGSAREIIVAENDDADGLVMMRQLRPLVVDRNVRLRVVLQSPLLARSRQVELAGTAADFRTAVVSLAQASAQRLIDFFPVYVDRKWEHVVVAGRGDVAREIAVEAVQRRSARAEFISIDAFGDAAESWIEVAQRQLNMRDVDFVAHVKSLDAELLCSEIVECCTVRPAPHLIFVAGLADADALAIGTILEAALPGSRLVTLLDRDPFIESPVVPLVPTGGWNRVTLDAFLADPSLLRTSVSERLAVQLSALLENLRGLSAADAAATLLGRRLEGGGADAATDFALELLDAVHQAGFVILPRIGEWNTTLEREPRESLKQELARRYGAPADPTAADRHNEHLSLLVSQLPVMINNLEFELKHREGTSRT